MSHILILYYSSFGHVETLANEISVGAKQVGANVDIKRVPELIPHDVAVSHGFKLDQSAPIAKVSDLPNYDAIIIGGPTRFGRICSQLASFLEQTGGLWEKGALLNKVGAAFTSTGTQHGGQETTLYSIISNFLHHGMIVTGLPYSCEVLSVIDEVSGGSPYGATTIAGPDGSRRVSDNEKNAARFLGDHVAKITARLNK